MLMKKQSSLHSFIVDSQDCEGILDLFDGHDVEAIKGCLQDMEYGNYPTIPEWQMNIINYYNSVSAIKHALFKGLDNTIAIKVEPPVIFQDFNYENEKLELQDNISERTYLKVLSFFIRVLHKNGNILAFEEGEISSNASAFRRNADRSKEDRQSSGHKIDGILYCLTASNAEIGAIEGGKKNEYWYGSKVLSDGLKMSKVLKDMFDTLISHVHRLASMEAMLLK
ncbi:hypothetical protein BGZ76_003080 [Entomortierella beljakovae]|nr:hypothetical protein BGZ76_003080 [Entomortierella beljakovae]